MKKDLTPEEKALWQSASSDVKPLAPSLKHPPILATKVSQSPQGVRQQSLQQTNHQSSYQLTNLDSRQLKNIVIDDTLDFHGYQISQVERALARFLQTSQQRSYRWVLMITGKGLHSSENQQGSIKQTIQDLLPRYSQFVVGFSMAKPLHGGGGALYVKIRRLRSWQKK